MRFDGPIWSHKMDLRMVVFFYPNNYLFFMIILLSFRVISSFTDEALTMSLLPLDGNIAHWMFLVFLVSTCCRREHGQTQVETGQQDTGQTMDQKLGVILSTIWARKRKRAFILYFINVFCSIIKIYNQSFVNYVTMKKEEINHKSHFCAEYS